MIARSYSVLSLPVLCFSQILPIVPIPNPTKAHAPRFGCLDRFRNEDAIITFSDPSENHFVDYAIITKYRQYYPDLLKPALQAKDYHLTTLNVDEVCGWRKARSVYGKAGFEHHSHHGDIYWKYNDVRKEIRPKTHTTPPNSQPGLNLQVFPRAIRLPNNQTIDAISLILEVSEPAADVYAFCNILLWMLCCCLLFASVPFLIKACTKCSAADGAELDGSEENENIELQPIRTPADLQANLPDRVSVPTDLHKPVQTRIYEVSSQFHNTNPSEPPPSYSFNESGR